MMTHTPHVRVALYVRTSSLLAPVDATLRSLDRLAAEGAVDEFTVDTWLAEVRLDNPAPHAEVVDLFEKFTVWAEQWGVSIRPPFAVETHTSAITGESRQVLTTPVQCLVVSVNGALAEVFPHSAERGGEGETYTVPEALTLLADRELQAVGARQAPDSPSRERSAEDRPDRDAEARPICDTRLVSG